MIARPPIVFVTCNFVKSKKSGIINADKGNIWTISKVVMKLRLPLNFIRAIATLAKVAKKSEMRTVISTTMRLFLKLV